MKIQLLMKRLLDILISFSALILFSPLIIVLMAMVFTKLGRPIFFLHERPGKNCKKFYMIKFRSMLNKSDSCGNLLSDAERLTPFGRAIRKLSLDELPELLNVIKGDMSLVGPRPLISEYIPLYNKRQAKRHDMLPGITGWAQVNGRNSIGWEQKFEYDVWYIENWSLLLDFKILFLTIWKVFKREGINQIGDISSEKWRGNNIITGVLINE